MLNNSEETNYNIRYSCNLLLVFCRDKPTCYRNVLMIDMYEKSKQLLID